MLRLGLNKQFSIDKLLILFSYFYITVIDLKENKFRY